MIPAAAMHSYDATPPGHDLPEVKSSILIVDDREANLLATGEVLKHLGATVHKAINGKDALALMEKQAFAVVLLDVQMPEMDGFEVAMHIREHPLMKNTPIIFVTAVNREERYATQAAEIGAVDFIFKPINVDILRSKVKVYLDIFVQREQILRLNAVLRQSNEELERFAYICSHDMQEPVRMMNLYGELLEKKYRPLLDEKGLKYLSFITSNARQMLKLTRDILSFSRVGREELRVETVDCNEIARQVLAEFEPVILENHASISLSSLPVLSTSETLIRVLLQNLIGNALKFQDGTRTPEIAIKAELENGKWLFTLTDNGIGIDPQFDDKVFAIFQRIHRKEDYPGTGIGLSTCRKFVELYGGEIWYEPAPQHGTVFYFTIPERPGKS